MSQFIRWFSDLSMQDVAEVGGKNASLGQMISNLTHAGIKVPNGFATTAFAYQSFLEENQLIPQISVLIDDLDIDNLASLKRTGHAIRQLILQADFSNAFLDAITAAYQVLCDKQQSVAVRSSATAEDLPDASFAGQQETYLNVMGLPAVIESIKQVFASLFNDRAIVYRKHHGFADLDVKISAGVQLMVRSDLAASGVMFSIDPESGHPDVVFITGAYGLGETVVQGEVNPDEFYLNKRNIADSKPAVIHKHLGSKKIKMIFADKGTENQPVTADQQMLFCLNGAELAILGEAALKIEKHYQQPMDIEWAKDGLTGEIFIVQARPETVQRQKSAMQIEHFQLNEQPEQVLIEGRSVGNRIGQGQVRILKSIDQMTDFKVGEVLVADMTDPDWEPIMAKAAAIVTNRGGRTCHAAIIARELGIPAVVGCGNATSTLQSADWVTVSCAEGDIGYVYPGTVDYQIKTIDLAAIPELPVKIMMNLGNPEKALAYSKLPNEGVGLARLEFIISNTIGIHPNALLQFDSLQDETLKAQIQARTQSYGNDPKHFYVEKLTEAMCLLATAFYPKPVIFRLSDFKSNEYASLLGGHLFEPQEENPMIGFRGASRYVSDSFKDAFALECAAVKRARQHFALDNIKIMIPFVRTVNEAKQVNEILAAHDLKRGQDGLQVYMMCEIPANAILADQFLEHFDGFSIGSNDLTQLTLGLDRDSALIAHQFDERNDAVKVLLTQAIQACQKQGKYVGICGQGPSDHMDLCEWLVAQKIGSMSLNPDSILPMYLNFS